MGWIRHGAFALPFASRVGRFVYDADGGFVVIQYVREADWVLP